MINFTYNANILQSFQIGNKISVLSINGLISMSSGIIFLDYKVYVLIDCDIDAIVLIGSTLYKTNKSEYIFKL